MSEELQKAVENAAATAVEEKPQEETKTETEETKTEETEPVLDQRTTQALQLMDALEDPKKAVAVVQNLMQQLGLQVPQSKQEERKAEKTIRDLVKEELGTDYEFLADKLGTAVEKAMALQEQKFLEIEQAKEAKSAAKEYETFITDNKVTDSEAGELMKLVDELPWSGRGSLTNYLSRILKMHRSEVSDQKAEVAKKQKQAENFEKRPKTLGVEANDERVIKGSKIVSAREAVEAALRGELLE